MFPWCLIGLLKGFKSEHEEEGDLQVKGKFAKSRTNWKAVFWEGRIHFVGTTRPAEPQISQGLLQGLTLHGCQLDAKFRGFHVLSLLWHGNIQREAGSLCNRAACWLGAKWWGGLWNLANPQQVDKQTVPEQSHASTCKVQRNSGEGKREERTLKVRKGQCQKKTAQKKSLGKHLKA